MHPFPPAEAEPGTEAPDYYRQADPSQQFRQGSDIIRSELIPERKVWGDAEIIGVPAKEPVTRTRRFQQEAAERVLNGHQQEYKGRTQ